jgi:fibronectin-binding autotransporter adhesin
MRSSFVLSSLLSTSTVLAVACGDDSTGTTESGTDSATDSTTDSTTTVSTTVTTSISDGTTTDATTTDATTTDATTTDATDSSSTGATSVCGDGVIEGDEVCDDGNEEDDDGCSADCQTATCLVPISHETVQAGIDDDDCSTVWILAGVYAENVTVDRTVVLQGIPLDDEVVIDGTQSGVVVTTEAPSLTLADLVITGGMASEGAGIHATGSVILERTTVTDNLATGGGLVRGGGIYIEEATLTLIESSVGSNSASGVATQVSGGGIHAFGSMVDIGQASSVSGNLASSAGADGAIVRGGGIALVGSEMLLEGGSRVENNEAQNTSATGGGGIASGGGIYVEQQGYVLTEDVRIGANVASADTPGSARALGGGLFLTGGSSADLETGTVVDSNVVTAAGATPLAAGGGPAAQAECEVITLQARIVDNVVTAEGEGESTARGGGLDFDEAALTPLTLESSVVEANVVTANATTPAGALALGGGLRGTVSPDAEVSIALYTVESSTFTANQILGNGDGFGGAIELFAPAATLGEVQVVNSSVSDNSAGTTLSARGGGIAVRGASPQVTARIANSTLTGNTATTGGGVSTDGANAAIHPWHTILWGNVANASPECVGFVDPEGRANVLGTSLDGCTVNLDDAIQVDPQLGALADNGGPTRTHAIDDTSSAYNAGAATCGHPDNAAGPITVDQRGEARAGDCTLGSFEPQ